MSTRFSLSMQMNRLTRDGTAEPVSETKFSGANADREIFVFPVQLTTCRIGNLNRLIHTLAICVTIHGRLVFGAVHGVEHACWCSNRYYYYY